MSAQVVDGTSRWWEILWTHKQVRLEMPSLDIAAIIFVPYWDASAHFYLVIRVVDGLEIRSRVWKSSEMTRVRDYAHRLKEQFEHNAQDWIDVLFSKARVSDEGIEQTESFVFDTSRPLSLESISVAKPWGEEIWYTGVERRGVCSVRLPVWSHPRRTHHGSEMEGDLCSVPLPFVELALGCACIETRCSIVLLKELLPFDQLFYGELYTEAHTQKAETYIVTGLGADSSPNGQGKVKLGISPQFARNWTSGSSLEVARRLKAYEQVRERVDKVLEESGYDFKTQVQKKELGPGLLEQAKRALVPQSLLNEERQAYLAVNDLFITHELSLGDIVRVPILTPHALQPGVRVVEFQTPSYERFILSSNQKVLTQDGWNIEEGLLAIRPDLGTEPISRVNCKAGFEVRELVSFTGLCVKEISLTPKGQASERLNVLIEQEGNAPLVVLPLFGGEVFLQNNWDRSLESGKGYLLASKQMRVELASSHGQRVALLVGANVKLSCTF